MKTVKLVLFILFLCINLLSQNLKPIRITEDIEYIKLSDNSYIITTYAVIGKFGRTPCNEFAYINDGEALLFNTPVNDGLTEKVVKFIQDSLKSKVTGFVPNHWHLDCIGGLNYIHKNGIKSYGLELTRKIAKQKKLPLPEKGFSNSLKLKLGKKEAICKFYGAGHSSDNIVVWIPSDKILFGGCMIKEFASQGLGNTEDANLKEWPKSVQKVLKAYPDVKTVIPGHGMAGGKELLEHTLELLVNAK